MPPYRLHHHVIHLSLLSITVIHTEENLIVWMDSMLLTSEMTAIASRLYRRIAAPLLHPHTSFRPPLSLHQCRIRHQMSCVADRTIEHIRSTKPSSTRIPVNARI